MTSILGDSNGLLVHGMPGVGSGCLDNDKDKEVNLVRSGKGN